MITINKLNSDEENWNINIALAETAGRVRLTTRETDSFYDFSLLLFQRIFFK